MQIYRLDFPVKQFLLISIIAVFLSACGASVSSGETGSGSGGGSGGDGDIDTGNGWGGGTSASCEPVGQTNGASLAALDLAGCLRATPQATMGALEVTTS